MRLAFLPKRQRDAVYLAACTAPMWWKWPFHVGRAVEWNRLIAVDTYSSLVRTYYRDLGGEA